MSIIQKDATSITFKIEELERPKELVKEKPLKDIVAEFTDTLEYLPSPNKLLVSGANHSFLMGMYLAYSEHRPFTLSPDMIWLLIIQGISNHVNFCYHKDAPIFSKFSKKKKIIVRNDDIEIGNPNSNWEKGISEFTNEIESIMGEALISKLRSDFSTTTTASRLASEVTIMSTFKEYFEFIQFVAICGIPEMKVEGTLDDWNHMLKKLEVLNEYDMNWWYLELKPILEKIRDTVSGIIDSKFWMEIFKIHTIDGYGAPKRIDGWITKFYPYDRIGNRISWDSWNFISINDILKDLPKELVSVDFIHRVEDGSGRVLKEYPLEYTAGFIGVNQDHKTQYLAPEIGWYISHRESFYDKDIKDDFEDEEWYLPSKKYFHLTGFPEDIFKNKKWEALVLNFIDKVVLPDAINQLEIQVLSINGIIDDVTYNRLLKLLNNKISILEVNGKQVVLPED